MPEVSRDDANLKLPSASPELLDRVRKKGRQILFAVPGSEELEYLDYMGAEANVGGPCLTHILLRENPTKIAVLEEFLHGTQSKLGLFQAKNVPPAIAEVRLKDFMISHRRLLGLTDNEIEVLKDLRRREKQNALARGYNDY